MIQQDSVINISDSLSNISNQNNDSALIKSIVKPTIDKTLELTLNPINSSIDNWIFYWISIIGILILLSKILFPKHFNNVIQALLNNRAYNNLLNEGVIWRHPINIILTSAYILSISLIIFISISYSLSNNLDISLAIKMALSIVALVVSKMFIVLFTQIIFQIRALLSSYLNYLFLSYSFLGIVLFFILWILIYTNSQLGINISVVIITLVYIFRMYKLLSLCNSKNNFNLFHFIIYLCTVEILPLILFRKLYFIWLLNN